MSEPDRKSSSPEARESAKAAPSILRLYLRETGATPLLDKQAEVRLATQIKIARLAIAKLAQSLPESCGEFVLAAPVGR